VPLIKGFWRIVRRSVCAISCHGNCGTPSGFEYVRDGRSMPARYSTVINLAAVYCAIRGIQLIATTNMRAHLSGCRLRSIDAGHHELACIPLVLLARPTINQKSRPPDRPPSMPRPATCERDMSMYAMPADPAGVGNDMGNPLRRCPFHQWIRGISAAIHERRRPTRSDRGHLAAWVRRPGDRTSARGESGAL
jgi:hypothetical protein